jgi:hypothetical protein
MNKTKLAYLKAREDIKILQFLIEAGRYIDGIDALGRQFRYDKVWKKRVAIDKEHIIEPPTTEKDGFTVMNSETPDAEEIARYKKKYDKSVIEIADLYSYMDMES